MELWEDEKQPPRNKTKLLNERKTRANWGFGGVFYERVLRELSKMCVLNIEKFKILIAYPEASFIYMNEMNVIVYT